MEQERQYRRELEQAQDDFIRENRKITDQFDQLFQEKHSFIRALEETGDTVRYTLGRHEEQAPIELSQVYYLIEEAQEEGLFWAKEQERLLEEQREEIAFNHKRQTLDYEEKIIACQKERSEADV
jgi:type I site-specific restriction-modification system R (restriction) subunit